MMGEPIVILLVEDDPALSPRPGLVLLDVRLPKVDGLEVLSIVKNDPELRRTPVGILTTSAAERDMARAYDAHANSYLTKPVDHEQFQGLLETLGYYWLVWNRRPYEAGA